MKRRDLITLLGGTDVSPTAALAQFTLKNNDAGATDTVEKLGSGKDKMSDLLGLVISAHGGAEQWNQLSRVSAHVRGGGLLWTVKGEEGVFGDRTVNAELHYQWLSYSPFRTPELSTGYMPDRVAIIRADGSTVQERCEPRASFAGHQRETLWDDLQAIYFSSYAMWNYLTEPFLLTYPGVKTQEIEPWNEEGERWRRLKAQFPPQIATHSAEQIFCYDEHGLLKRHDYSVEISGNTLGAQYVYDHKEFDGIVLPTKRRVFPRLSDGKPLRERVVISIDLD